MVSRRVVFAVSPLGSKRLCALFSCPGKGWRFEDAADDFLESGVLDHKIGGAGLERSGLALRVEEGGEHQDTAHGCQHFDRLNEIYAVLVTEMDVQQDCVWNYLARQCHEQGPRRSKLTRAFDAPVRIEQPGQQRTHAFIVINQPDPIRTAGSCSRQAALCALGPFSTKIRLLNTVHA